MGSQLIEKTKAFVKAQLQGAEAGHDWFHVERVYKLAHTIAKGENVNLLVVQLGALLHDIADAKFHGGDETIGPKVATRFLTEQQASPQLIEQVVQIICHISFKGGNQKQTYTSPELQVVQDADRLDAIGAIGIARAFNYGGHKNKLLYDPSVSPKLDMTKTEYKNSTAPTINHFYEKLLLLKNRMNTKTGRKIAEERHRFMQAFLQQFFNEWEGEK